MDAVEFLKEKNRMMRTDSEAYNEIKDIPTVQAVVAYVEDWSQKHPRKTMAQDFFEKYPNAPRTEDDMPFPCPDGLGYCKHDSFCLGHTCMECWSRPMED